MIKQNESELTNIDFEIESNKGKIEIQKFKVIPADVIRCHHHRLVNLTSKYVTQKAERNVEVLLSCTLIFIHTTTVKGDTFIVCKHSYIFIMRDPVLFCCVCLFVVCLIDFLR